MHVLYFKNDFCPLRAVVSAHVSLAILRFVLCNQFPVSVAILSKINDDDDDKSTGFNLVDSRLHTRNTVTENAVSDLPSQSMHTVVVAVAVTVTVHVTLLDHTN